MLVAEIKRDNLDAAAAKIVEVYQKQPPHYAIYRTDERVMVHYADDEEEAKQQSAVLAPLNPARGEIYGLIDGWRVSRLSRRKSRASGYFRRIADALGIALQNDAADSLTMLDGIKTDIVDERTSWARFQYLMAASFAAIAVIVLVWLIVHAFAPAQLAWELLFALAGGTIGAFFSVAIAIRGRTVLTDLHWTNNSADAVLRVIIGAIAAGVLVSLVRLGAIKFAIGDQALNTDVLNGWLYILVVAFVAGFSERLVPDLLEKSSADSSGQTAVPKPPLDGRGANGAGQVPNAMQDHPNAMHDQAAEDENRMDDCLCDKQVQPHEETSDAELPVATGGIAFPRATARAAS